MSLVKGVFIIVSLVLVLFELVISVSTFQLKSDNLSLSALPLPLPLQAPSTIEYNFPYLLFSIKMLDHLMCVRNPIDFNFCSNKDRKTSSFCGNVADRTIYTITTWRTILRKKKIAASSIPSAVAIHTNRLNSLHCCWDRRKVFRLLATMSKSTLDFHATARRIATEWLCIYWTRKKGWEISSAPLPLASC